MNTIGYDFGDTYVEVGELSIAVRLATVGNVYAPDPASVAIHREGSSVKMTANKLSAAGGQLTMEGSIEWTLEKDESGRYRMAGAASHATELCKSILVLIRGLEVSAIVSESDNMGKSLPNGPYGIGPVTYPGREATMPLVFFETNRGDWFALSKDTQPRKKAVAVQYDGVTGQRMIVLAHEEDRRAWSNAMSLPAWRFGPAPSRPEAVRERCRDLEQVFGLMPHPAKPLAQVVDDLRVVVNLHGEHWTGHVFNTFAEMADHLRWIGSRIDGRRVLAFLPAWDGRYYTTYPYHEPSDRLGGSEGLKELVETAHELGMRIVPMLGGPNLASFEFIEQFGLQDSALKNEQGLPLLQDWVDWNSDLSKECMGYIVNYGHPGLRSYMLARIEALFETYKFDGVFLDGAIRWSNAPDYSPLEGVIALANGIRSKYPDKILMAEDGYDLLWGHFDMFATSWGPVGLERAMLRYTRQTEYLAYPGMNGSGGVHEVAWHWDTIAKRIPECTIPTLTLFRNDTKVYGREIEAYLEACKRWSQST